jgi:hypothetical protein
VRLAAGAMLLSSVTVHCDGLPGGEVMPSELDDTFTSAAVVSSLSQPAHQTASTWPR